MLRRKNGKLYPPEIPPIFLSTFVFVVVNAIALFYYFIHDAIFVFLGFFIFGGLFLIYIFSIIKSIFAKGKTRKKSLTINVLTPIICIVIIVLHLPIYVNFYLLYPFRMKMINEAELSSLDEAEYSDVVAPYGLEITETSDGTIYYFKLKEEFLLSGDFSGNVYAANSGIEYLESGFKDKGRVLTLDKSWRYVSYSRQTW